MGVFEFVRNAGAKLFGNKKAQAESDGAEPVNHAREAYLRAQDAEREEKEHAVALNAMLAKYGYDASRLNISVQDGVVELTGAIDTQTELEAIVLLLGNTDGVSRVNEEVKVLTPTPPARFYTVVHGDNLSKIAQRFYGSPGRHREIFEANQPMLSDPNQIYPGQVLRIPADADA